MTNPENTSTDSKVDVRIKMSVTPDCTKTAITGICSLLFLAMMRNRRKSSPITCNTLGPAITMALTVETSNVASMIPITMAPVSPK
ncbi:uncharacterized protein METZ01_LOCUS450869, partial [marine metagenome]